MIHSHSIYNGFYRYFVSKNTILMSSCDIIIIGSALIPDGLLLFSKSKVSPKSKRYGSHKNNCKQYFVC